MQVREKITDTEMKWHRSWEKRCGPGEKENKDGSGTLISETSVHHQMINARQNDGEVKQKEGSNMNHKTTMEQVIDEDLNFWLLHLQCDLQLLNASIRRQCDW